MRLGFMVGDDPFGVAGAAEIEQRSGQVHADVDLPVGVGDLVDLLAVRRENRCYG